MCSTSKHFGSFIFLTIILILTLAISTACSSVSSGSGDNVGVESAGGEVEDGEHEHEDEHEDIVRIPNNGASIQIISPLDGATFSESENLAVEVQVDNIELGVDGNHWHIYVDGKSWSMVTGGDTDQELGDLEHGVFEISVFLTLRSHEELEDGDAVTITVEAAE